MSKNVEIPEENGYYSKKIHKNVHLWKSRINFLKEKNANLEN